MENETLFKYRLRKPKKEDKLDCEGLELAVSLFDLDKKKKKDNQNFKNVREEGSFLLNESGRIMAVGSFYVAEEEGKKFLVVNSLNPTFPDYRKKAIEALKKYAENKGYGYRGD